MADDTLSKVLLEVGDIKGSVGEIKGTLNGFLVTQTRHSDDLEALNKRVSALEKERARLIGAFSVIAGIASVGAAYIGKKIGI